MKAVISQVPFTSGEAFVGGLPKEQLDKIYANRTHNVASEYLPLFYSSREEIGVDTAHKPILATEDAYDYSLEAVKRAQAEGAKWENRVSVQTLYHMLKNEPINFIHRIAPRPLLYVIATKDTILRPDLQRKAYDKAGEGKQLLELDAGHFDAYRGPAFETNVKAQVKFLEAHL